jgi:hypothetical protein
VLVGLHLVQLAVELLDLRREVSDRAAQLLVLGLRVRVLPRAGSAARRRLLVGGADDARLVRERGRRHGLRSRRMRRAPRRALAPLLRVCDRQEQHNNEKRQNCAAENPNQIRSHLNPPANEMMNAE